MKIIFTPMLLKLNLALFFMFSASVFVVNGQTTSTLATPSQDNVRGNDIDQLPKNDAALNEYSTLDHKITPMSRPMVAPFQCDNGLVYIITNTTSSNGNVSGLHSYNLGNKTQTLVKYPLVESKTSSQFINAIGYNVVDNYIYGLLQGTNQVTKIDATGAIEFLTITGDFVAGDYSSGDVDKDGIFYMYGKGIFVAINLNPSAPDYLVGKTLLREAKTFNDMAFSPVDDNLYMITSNSRRTLLRFNTSTNTLTSIGDVSGLTSETTNSFGTAFMDSLGNMYVSNNASGKIYKIALPHTGATTATLYNSLSGTPGDGARCPYVATPPNAEDDQTCGVANEIITIDLLENDGEGTYPIDIASVKLSDPITNEKSTTVTVAGQGTFQVDNKGIVTFTPLPSFTDASITYTIVDTAGVLSHWASISVRLNLFEVTCPTFADLSVECYDDLPNQTSYSIAEFEALGNGDGRINDDSCGIIEITASNSSDKGTCSQIITRTYTITEYYDTNKNGIRDASESKVINTTECVQFITVEDTTAPNLVTAYEQEVTISCDIVPEVPELVFEDACSNNIEVVFAETSTDTGNAKNYVITRTWSVSDNCENEAIYTQTLTINRENAIAGRDTEFCNDDDIDFDLFSLLSGTATTDGIWTVVTGNATLDGSIFNPYQLNLGRYTFKYTVEDEFCPNETLVNISLNNDCVVLPCGEEDVVISKAVTTFADKKNDFFTITGVETCGFTYEVQIFNRWGAMIYESKNYQNDWNGTASKASIGSSNYVPTGTYYYVVNLKNSGLKPFAGALYVATK